VTAGLVAIMIWQQPNLAALYRALLASRGAPAVPSEQVSKTPHAVLYEEDPADQQGRRLAGSAVWRTDAVPSGTNEPPDIVVRGEIEIPDRKMSVAWMLRHDTDQSRTASHTIEISFMLPPDFPGGGILNVPGVWMKEAEDSKGAQLAKGTALAGLSAKVATGYFLIGLSATPAERERNVQLLKDWPWFEMPIVYANNRRAILAIEKGASGDDAFKRAFAAWEK
jgi:hypothetical protein